ncbi:MAG: hypothetical protein EA401_05870 [Planctomycetota bacterium]|nr:MAG: hypothetical protein EA401_05870 [Planctomycetota bacterium]
MSFSQHNPHPAWQELSSGRNADESIGSVPVLPASGNDADESIVVQDLHKQSLVSMEDWHEAQHISLQRPVVIKDMTTPHSTMYEAIAMAAVEHPAVPAVHAITPQYMMLQHLRGHTLAQLIARGDVSPEALADILVRVAEALACTHAQGIIHRDLQPRVIVCDDRQAVYCCGWSLSCAIDAKVADATGLPLLHHLPQPLAGTPAWLAPEMARGDITAIGTASDCFQLGAILAAGLGADPPFAAASAQAAIARAAANDRNPLPLSAPPALARLVAALCQEDPSQRPTAAAAAEALQEFIRSAEARKHAQAVLSNITQHSSDNAALLLSQESDLLRARDCDPDLEGIDDALDQVRAGLIQAALSNNDVALAQATLHQVQDHTAPRSQALASQVQQAALQMEQRQRSNQRLRRLSLSLFSASLVVGLATSLWLAGQAQWRQQQRMSEARQLLTEQPNEADAMAALALAGNHPSIRQGVIDVVYGAAQTAIAEESLELARARLQLAQQLGLEPERAAALDGSHEEANTIAWLEHAPQRQRQALIHQRREQLKGIIAQLQDDPAIRYQPLRLQALAANIAPWLVSQDGDEMLHAAMKDMLRNLHTHPHATVRALAISTSALVCRASSADRRRWHQDWTLTHLASSDRDLIHLTMRHLDDLRLDEQQAQVAAAALLARSGGNLLREHNPRSIAATLRTAFAEVTPHVAAMPDNQQRDATVRYLLGMRQRLLPLSVQQGLYRLSATHQTHESLRLHRSLSQMLLRRDSAGTERIARHILEQGPSHGAYRAWAAVLVSTGDFTQAAPIIATGMEHFPNSLDLQALHIRVLVHLGETDQANAAVDHLLGREFTHLYSTSTQALVEALRQLNREDDAVQLASRRGLANPDDMWGRLNYARSLYQAGRYDDSLDEALRITMRWTAFHHGYQHLSRSYLAVGERAAALQAADNALAILPRNNGILTDHGRALAANGRFDNALSRVLMGHAMNQRWTLPGMITGFIAARNAHYDGHALEFTRRLMQQQRSNVHQSIGRHHRIRMALEHHAGDEAIALLTDPESSWSAYWQRLSLGCFYLSDPAYKQQPSWPGLSDHERLHILHEETIASLSARQPDPDRATRIISNILHNHSLSSRRHSSITWLRDLIELHQNSHLHDEETYAFMRQQLHDQLMVLRNEAFHDWYPFHFLADAWLLHLQSNDPLLPLPGDYRVYPRRPIYNIAWSKRGRQQLIKWWHEQHGSISHPERTSDPSDLDALGTSNTAQAQLRDLERSLGRGKRGWDFPPQVWQDRRRQQQESTDSSENEE